MTKRSGKQKNANVQGEYEEVFQPDSKPMWRSTLVLAFFVLVALFSVVVGVISDEMWIFVVMIISAGIYIGVGAAIVIENYWNRFLSFGINPKELTLLWDGQPAQTVPWSDVIEIFMASHGRYVNYYGVFISLQYGYQSRINKAEKHILNQHIRWENIKHLENFPVICLYESVIWGRSEKLLKKIEGYRNAAWAQSYEARTE